MEYEFITKYPPSVNNLYITRKDGRKCLAKQHIDFRNQLYFDALSQCNKRTPITGKAHLQVTLTPPDGRIRDIDNGLKSILDGIKNANLVSDDSQVKVLNVVMLDKNAKGQCHIKIKSLEELTHA